ncbi:fumarate reductase subunit D [Dyadobacter sp. BE34]|uniref:Fumarate reductase subunit D n=1 Tax=Dyadobacter fermentans TaxID=94254 RepID=A0ABU1QVX1_9BACT|nr:MULTISPECIES: M1 family aminopeptidase [Dyadobacter]MDR6805304.1 fumarate reductase subunit D [Dyadobacter fermentans]MDR7042936.1 fumarate reductase subunit D [Dyadobacter sp. BE242]MDR7197248.1 fumarate reductase subunit D [Dyadobacter sp. BE34]MDR7215317.1 fumarate reductase subunit D [Dyadobacter sp. BE31]MDR7262853.1 fumarate reductase subunit D [Dyadobacter sp. BE32]
MFRFEMGYHFRQISFRIAALLFLIFGVLMPFGNFGGEEIHRNAPHVINFIICLLSLFTIFVSTLAGAAVVLRDAQHRMEPLIFTTSIGRMPYFVVRLAGLLTAVFLVMCLAAAGAAMVTFIAPAGQLGPFHLSYYLVPLLLFGLPGVVFCCSIVFATALLTRNVRWVYTAGVLMFIVYFTASILGNSPVMAGSIPAPGGPGWVAVLIDPFGFTAFFGETMNWPVWRRNQELFPITPLFVANRLLWTAISLAMLALSYNRFKFRILSENDAPPARKQVAQKVPAIAYRTIRTRTGGLHYLWPAFWRTLRLETKTLFSNPVITTLIFALWVFFNAIELFENLSNGPYGVRSYATSGILAEQLVAVRPALLLILFYASELIHREKTTGIEPLIFSTPVSVTAFAIAKSLALVFWILALITVHISVGVAVQWFSGFEYFEWQTYFSLYYYAGLPLVLYAILILFIQTIIPNKYLGILISGLIIGIFIFGRKLGLESYLTRFATAPRLRYSDFDGFGHSGLSFNWYMCYWTLVALALAGIGTRMWAGYARGRIRTGITSARAALVFSSVCALLAIGTGIFIQYRTGFSAHNRTGTTNAEWQAQYERKYKPLASLPQPVVTDVHLQTDLFPADHYYTVKGSMRIKNKSGQPITRLCIGTDPEVELISLAPEQASRMSSDETFGQHGYRPDVPLAPGAEMTIRFAIRADRSGLKPFNSEHSVAANGSYIELEKYLPYLGYRAAYEIEDPEERRQNGLPVRRDDPSSDHEYHFIQFQNVISTEAGQQAITVGTLVRSWVRAGRRYFHYQSESPIPYMFALSAARYAVKTEKYKGTTFRIYHHPGHLQNIAAMMLAMKDAVDYGNAHFGPYPRRELTLAEIPHYPGSATAYPGLIFSQERTNFRSDLGDSTGFNFTYATAAHETAHQWWAEQVAAPSGPGYALLTESLAKYTEAMVTEKRLGKMYLRPYHVKDSQLYFAYRNATAEREIPLWQTTDQPFVYYQKGGLALFRLKEVLGETHFNRALLELVKLHGYPLRKPDPASLVDALKCGTNTSQARLVDELFKKVIVFDNDIKILSNKPLPDNKQLLTLEINVRKTDETSGKPVLLKPDDAIDIAVFDQQITPNVVPPKPVYLRRHHFSQNRSVIQIVVPREAAAIVLDPLSYMLDVSDHNNIVILK